MTTCYALQPSAQDADYQPLAFADPGASRPKHERPFTACCSSSRDLALPSIESWEVRVDCAPGDGLRGSVTDVRRDTHGVPGASARPANRCAGAQIKREAIQPIVEERNLALARRKDARAPERRASPVLRGGVPLQPGPRCCSRCPVILTQIRIPLATPGPASPTWLSFLDGELVRRDPRGRPA